MKRATFKGLPGAVTEIEIPYLVFGVADESAALATAANMKGLISDEECAKFQG